MHLALPNEAFARTIATDSEGSCTQEGDRWVVEADTLTINLDHCAAAAGRALTSGERCALRHEGKRLPGYQIIRLGPQVTIRRDTGRRTTGWSLPAPMLDALKRNAAARNLSLGQLFAEMCDYYLTTFGDADALGAACASGETRPSQGATPTLGVLPRPGVTPQAHVPFPRDLLPDRAATFLATWREQRAALLK